MAILHRELVDQKEIDAIAEEARAALAPDVVRIRYSLDVDWSGDPAIHFRVVLSDDASRDERLGEASRSVIRTISDLLVEQDIDLQAYFNFRSQSEIAADPEEGWT